MASLRSYAYKTWLIVSWSFPSQIDIMSQNPVFHNIIIVKLLKTLSNCILRLNLSFIVRRVVWIDLKKRNGITQQNPIQNIFITINFSFFSNFFCIYTIFSGIQGGIKQKLHLSMAVSKFDSCKIIDIPIKVEKYWRVSEEIRNICSCLVGGQIPDFF